MDDRFDLDAYLARIGYEGPRAPTLDVLRAVHRRHAEAIAFENLDPYLRRPLGLDAGSLQAKLVRAGRGGWCFEQNGLLRLALDALGFVTTGLAARVLWNAPATAVTARGHMVLRVEVEGESYLADVGFGGQTLTAPLAFRLDVVQETPHEPYRLVHADEHLLLETHVRDAWRPLYRFDLQPQLPPDYEVSSWYLANHPASHFLSGLIAARPAAGRRNALRDNQLTTHHLGGGSETRLVETPEALRETLTDVFGLVLPEGPELERALVEIAARRPSRPPLHRAQTSTLPDDGVAHHLSARALRQGEHV
ncbi:MAG TPA: arylamine N-acetyltransferase [Gemmatimonadaceae bacterium]|nr:arylamine N-acetyltransferase [Gemmatimonadaceae bacterium]